MKPVGHSTRIENAGGMILRGLSMKSKCPVFDAWEKHQVTAESLERKCQELAPEWIKSLMETMSLRQIARRCKRSPTYISMVLNGHSRCSMLTFKKLEELYNNAD